MAALSMAGPTVSVPVSPVWPVISPPGVYQGNSPYCSLAEVTGDEDSIIHGRFPLDSTDIGGSSSSSQINGGDFQHLGFMINYTKSLLSPLQELEFLGVQVSSCPPTTSQAKRLGNQSGTFAKEVIFLSLHLGERDSSVYWHS